MAHIAQNLKLKKILNFIINYGIGRYFNDYVIPIFKWLRNTFFSNYVYTECPGGCLNRFLSITELKYHRPSCPKRPPTPPSGQNDSSLPEKDVPLQSTRQARVSFRKIFMVLGVISSVVPILKDISEARSFFSNNSWNCSKCNISKAEPTVRWPCTAT